MLRFAASLALCLPLAAAHFEPSALGWTAVHGASASDSAVRHGSVTSIRVEGDGSGDERVQSSAVQLTIGKRYELSGWVRTDSVQVRDTARSPIAIGAALSMASMPFDVHSESLAGTHDWTRLTLRFVATRANDNIVLTAGEGGSFRGKAWLGETSIDEISTQDSWPAKAAVTTFGPAYRYPVSGWIYLHIEGKPYERGYQHGFLMPREIEQYLRRCAAQLDVHSPKQAWTLGRTTSNALFLRGFDEEIRQEMQGIADGAAAAGAQWDGRPVDLMDIVVANTITEIGELNPAVRMTPTGLEGLDLTPPGYYDRKRDVSVVERCSAFAATGPATRDGKMVIAHLTMWPLTLAEQTNVLLDVKPVTGHRVLMQSYPGGIQSGTDWYQNDAGIVLTETTIEQSPFNVQGTPVAYRARKSIQYGDSVDKVVEYLGTHNNGLYTNEWLIGDSKTNEVAMYELGTYKTRLYRSSKNDWFGGTKGFYWGCNNAKDPDVRLEYQPDPHGEPAYVPYVPGQRDLKWQEFYAKYKGSIDEQFAFLAFRTAPIVSSTTLDAKVVTADMAARMMVWADFGKPNQREWTPRERDGEYPNDGLYPSGYRLITAEASPALRAAVEENERTRLASQPATPPKKPEEEKSPYKDQLWKGWVLPASAADRWFVAGSAAYYEDLNGIKLANAIAMHRAEYRRLASLPALDERQATELEMHKGALYLDELRHRMGDEAFFKLTNSYFASHATKSVTAESFLEAAGAKFTTPATGSGPAWVARDVMTRFSSAMIVYGTLMDAGANRYAAEKFQLRALNIFEGAVPIRKDFEVTDDDLRGHDIIFIGRPETNSAAARWSKQMNLNYDAAVFRIGTANHASETEALLMTSSNPEDHAHMVLLIAGNSALATVKAASVEPPATEYAIYKNGKETVSGFQE